MTMTELSWHQRNAGGFHRWVATDRTVGNTSDSGAPITFGVDQCLRCGVTIPDTPDETTLPGTCPGPDVRKPHTFEPLNVWTGGYVTDHGGITTFGGWTIYCTTCGYRVDQNQRPSDMRWECEQS